MNSSTSLILPLALIALFPALDIATLCSLEIIKFLISFAILCAEISSKIPIWYEELISLNDMHIVAIALPSNDLMKQFANAIGEEQMAAISKDGEMTSGEEFDVETWMDRLYNKKGGVEKNIQFHEMFDSDENVIRFPSGYKH